MQTAVRVGVATLLLGLIACAARDVTDAPNFSINGGNCSAKRAITLAEVLGVGMTDKALALTFDDGPSEVTAELSAYLASEKIAATFFINGVNVPGRETVLDQQIANGHLLANHTHTHRALTELAAKSPAELVPEVENTDKLLAFRVPQDKLFFRPPFGDWNEVVMKSLSSSPMQKYQGPVGWDIGDKLTDSTAADWDCWDEQNGTRTVPQCGDLYIKEIEAKKHGVVLLHDGPPGGNGAKTVEMVKYLVPRLKAAGYSFARIDQVPLQPLPPPPDPPLEEPPPAAAPPPKPTVAPADDPCAR